MPELPEVETITRALTRRLSGRRIVAVAQRRGDLRRPFPPRLRARLEGRRIMRFARRGKYILGHLDDGFALILHLGMSGRLLLDGAPEARHEHLRLAFDGGAVLRLVDPRRFGLVDLCPGADLDRHPLVAPLGLEPLARSFTARRLKAVLAGRRAPLKAALMDQRRIAGLGNIYVSEALFEARLSPMRPAGSLDDAEVERLVHAVRAVLRRAIDAGGSSLRDYVQADGELGNFQSDFAVYGREGAPCPRCRTPIARLVQSNRATFHCPRCQV